MTKTKTKGKGAIPDNCPACKIEDVEWDYEDIQIEGDQVWQEIYCPDCEAKFCEYYDLEGWELIQNGNSEDEDD